MRTKESSIIRYPESKAFQSALTSCDLERANRILAKSNQGSKSHELLEFKIQKALDSALLNIKLGKFHSVEEKYSEAYEGIELARTYAVQMPQNEIWEFEIELVHFEYLIARSEFKKVLELGEPLLADSLKHDDFGHRYHIYLFLAEAHINLGHYKIGEDILNQTFGLVGDDLPAQSKLFLLMGRIAIRRVHYEKVRKYHEKVMELANMIGDPYYQCESLNGMAMVFSHEENFKKALESLSASLDLSERIECKPGIARALMNTATIFTHLHNHKEALNRYNRLLDKYGDVIERRQLAPFNLNIAEIYRRQNNHEMAEQFSKKSLQYAKRYNDANLKGRTLSQLAQIRLSLGDLSKAEYYIQDALATFESKKTYGIQFCYDVLAQIAVKRKHWMDAIELGHQSLSAAEEKKDAITIISSYLILSEAYNGIGDSQNGLDYFKKYHKANDDLEREIRDRRTIDVEIRFETREKEKQLEALKKERVLQDELLQRQALIEHQNQELRQYNEEIKQFTYAAGHDLKEPLRMIGSYTSLITEEFGDDFSKDAQEYFGYVKNGVTRMEALLKGLLQFARVGEESFKEEKVNLNIVLAESVDNLSVKVGESMANVDSYNLPIVKSIRSLLLQLFQNLIGNAIKFSKPGIPPLIEVKAREDGNRWVISVADNGIGMNNDQSERVFQIFQRLHTTEYEGTGIGLAICKKIVTRLQGEIWIDSTPNEGTTFYFSLPK